MSENGTGAHTVTEEEEKSFPSERNTNTWKAVNSKPKALGRKTRLQVTQNKQKRPPRINLWEPCNCIIMKEQTHGQVFCSTRGRSQDS